MKLIRIKHYVDNSYERRPSFVLTMSDGRDYISNGGLFLQDTPEARERLIRLGYRATLWELFGAPSIEVDQLTNGRFMFAGCEFLTEAPRKLSGLVDGRYMFYFCELLTRAPRQLPALRLGMGMFYYCTSLIVAPQEMPVLVDGRCMLEGCKSLEKGPRKMPALNNRWGMFEGCTSLFPHA